MKKNFILKTLACITLNCESLAIAQENFYDAQNEQIQNILLPYEATIGRITDPLMEACIGISTDMVNLYMEYALRICVPVQKISQLDLVKIISQFKVIDSRSFTALSRVLRIVSGVHYKEDESKIELLELMAMQKGQMNNDDFFERLSYIENFPDGSEYLDFQFICNMLICDMTTVMDVMQHILSDSAIKNA